jgi:hypothetical protein
MPGMWHRHQCKRYVSVLIPLCGGDILIRTAPTVGGIIGRLADEQGVTGLWLCADRNYDRVIMADCDHGMCAKGKRWFCSGAEVRRQGGGMRCDNNAGSVRDLSRATARSRRGR